MTAVAVLIAKSADAAALDDPIAFATTTARAVVPFRDVATTVWRSLPGTVAVVAYEPVESYPGARLPPSVFKGDDGGVTTLLGWVVDPAAPDAPAGDVLDILYRKGPDAVAGVFISVRLDREGRGGVVRPVSGGTMVFLAETPSAWVLASSPVLAAVITGGTTRPEPDQIYHAGLIATAQQSYGWRTPFAGVTAVPPATRIAIAPGRLDLAEPAGDPFHDPSIAELHARAPEALWDRTHALLVGTMRGALALADPGAWTVTLTGGFDSRLVLALVAAAGRRDAIGRAEVRGAAFAPDAIVGRKLASLYDLRVQDGVPQCIPERFANDLLQHIHYYGAAMSPHDLFRRSMSDLRRPALFGHEIGAKDPARASLADMPAFERWLSNWNGHYDVLGVLRPEARAAARAWVDAWLRAVAPALDPDERANRFRVETRGPGWTSFAVAAEWTTRPAVNPLLIDQVMRLQASIGAKARRSLAFQHAMMIRCDPRLAEDIPFADKGWPEALEPIFAARGRTRLAPVEQTVGRGALFGGPGAVETLRGEVLDWLTADAASPVLDLVDPAAVRALAGRSLAIAQRRALLSLVQAKIALECPDFANMAAWSAGHDAAAVATGLPARTAGETVTVPAEAWDELRSARSVLDVYGGAIRTLL